MAGLNLTVELRADLPEEGFEERINRLFEAIAKACAAEGMANSGNEDDLLKSVIFAKWVTDEEANMSDDEFMEHAARGAFFMALPMEEEYAEED